ncbi:hypothetical protein LV156_009137, partial [Aspergillus fumigatus]
PLEGSQETQCDHSANPAPIQSDDDRAFCGWQLADRELERLLTKGTLEEVTMIFDAAGWPPKDRHAGVANSMSTRELVFR